METKLWQRFLGDVVQNLDLSHSEVTDNEISLVAMFLPHLRCLDLSATSLGSSAIAILARVNMNI